MILLVHLNPTGVSVDSIRVDDFTDERLLDLLVGPDRDLGTPGFLHGQLGRAPIADPLAQVLRDIGTLFTRPLTRHLRSSGARCVTLVAAGQLGLLPFHAAADVAGEYRLIDEFDVTYAPSARSLAECRRLAGHRRDSVLFAVGNPSVTDPLHFASAEIAGVSRLFRGTTHCLVERKATKAALFDEAPAASHVHLACHGRYEPYEPLRSRLQLADDEVLTLGEIIARRPFANSRLVVASACQTAITDFTTLPDEALGLPAGFLQAGTPGVLATLWEVNDLSTALLVIRFYAEHQAHESKRRAVSPAHALRMAQLWMAGASPGEILDLIRATEGVEEAVIATPRGPALIRALERSDEAGGAAPPFGDPVHWAGFVFVGS